MTTAEDSSTADIRRAASASAPGRMRRPWEKHLRMALVLAAIGFATGVFLNLMLGAALGAAALFVALRPLFMERGRT